MAIDEDMFDEESAFTEALDNLSEIERRHLLEKQGRIAADIELDLQDRGPLYLFVQQARGTAVAAMQLLARIDVNDGPGILRAQASVQQYIQALRFIHGGLEAGQQAEEIIHEEYGYHGGPTPDADLLQPSEPNWRRRR